MADKIYAGQGKIVNTKFGEMPKICLHKDNVNEIVKYMKANNSEFINLEMKKKRDQKDSKFTHYLEVDQWKPESKDTAQAIEQRHGMDKSDPLPTDEDPYPFDENGK